MMFIHQWKEYVLALLCVLAFNYPAQACDSTSGGISNNSRQSPKLMDVFEGQEDLKIELIDKIILPDLNIPMYFVGEKRFTPPAAFWYQHMYWCHTLLIKIFQEKRFFNDETKWWIIQFLIDHGADINLQGYEYEQFQHSGANKPENKFYFCDSARDAFPSDFQKLAQNPRYFRFLAFSDAEKRMLKIKIADYLLFHCNDLLFYEIRGKAIQQEHCLTTLLMHCCKKGSPELIQFLCQGSNTLYGRVPLNNNRDKLDTSSHPLVQTIRHNNVPAAQFFLNDATHVTTYLNNLDNNKECTLLIEAFKARNSKLMHMVREIYKKYGVTTSALSPESLKAVMAHPAPSELLEELFNLVGFEKIPSDIICRASIEKSPYIRKLIEMRAKLRPLFKKTGKPIDLLNDTTPLNEEYRKIIGTSFYDKPALAHAGSMANLEAIYELFLAGVHMRPVSLGSLESEALLSFLCNDPISKFALKEEKKVRRRLLLYWVYTMLNKERPFNLNGDPIARFQFCRSTQSFTAINQDQTLINNGNFEQYLTDKDAPFESLPKVIIEDIKVKLPRDIVNMQEDLAKKRLQMFTILRNREVGKKYGIVRKLKQALDMPALNELSSIR